MNDEEILGQLQQLHEIDREIAGHQAAIDKANRKLADAEQAVAAAGTARDEAAAALEANRAEERAGLRRLEDLRRSRASALRILESGAGSAEAAERQLENCDALIDEGETAQLELLEAQDGLVAALKKAESALSASQADLRLRAGEAPEVVAEHAAAKAAREAARGPVADALPRDVKERYQSFRQRGRWAVARVKADKTCEACAMVVQPQMVADLARGRVVACHGCHRWLLPPE
ncbi:MAG: hypothetical protein R3F59_22625 [Myxococcota bacterium]